MRKLWCLLVTLIAVYQSGCAQKNEEINNSSESRLASSDVRSAPLLSDKSNLSVLQDSSPVYVNAEMKPLHDSYERAFLRAPGFGIGRRANVGIIRPEVLAMEDGSKWRVFEAALLGIAEHDEPVVMSTTEVVTAEHQLAELAKHPTKNAIRSVEYAKARAVDAREKVRERELNAFELSALKRMNSGEAGPWMAEASDHGADCFRMMAAIRARQKCLKCHSEYREGDALGAFVYLLKQETEPPLDIQKPKMLGFFQQSGSDKSNPSENIGLQIRHALIYSNQCDHQG